MNEHLLYAYALGYHHAVSGRYKEGDPPGNGLTGELRLHYAHGFCRGVMDNINDVSHRQAQTLAQESTSAVDYRDIDTRR